MFGKGASALHGDCSISPLIVFSTACLTAPAVSTRNVATNADVVSGVIRHHYRRLLPSTESSFSFGGNALDDAVRHHDRRKLLANRAATSGNMTSGRKFHFCLSEPSLKTITSLRLTSSSKNWDFWATSISSMTPTLVASLSCSSNQYHRTTPMPRCSRFWRGRRDPAQTSL